MYPKPRTPTMKAMKAPMTPEKNLALNALLRTGAGIILAFNADDRSTWFFLGTSKAAVLADTEGGKKFAFTRFHSYRSVGVSDIYQYEFPHFAAGLDYLLAAIRDTKPLSYLIGILDEHGKPTEWDTHKL